MPDDIDHAFVEKKVNEYTSQLSAYKAYADFLAVVLKKAAKRMMPYCIVESRPKTIASFAEKVVRKQWKFQNIPGYDITDRCGARVVTQTAQEKAMLCEYIVKNLLLDPENSLDLKSQLGEREFGYLAVHYVVQIPDGIKELEGVPVPPRVLKGSKGFKAEIQVKTLLEHAWANPLHDRLYKVQITPPHELKREAAGLAATLEHADERLMTVAGDIDSYLGHYAAYMDQQRLDSEIKVLAAVVKFEKEPEKQAALRLTLGRLYKLAGNAELAKAEWDEYDDIESPSQDALKMELGALLCSQSREDKRSKAYLRGVALLMEVMNRQPAEREVDTITARRTRAEAAARLGREYSRQHQREEEARDCYRKALDLDASNPYHLSDFLSYEIFCTRNTDMAYPMRHYIHQAIGNCRKHIAVGIEQPRAQFTIGRLHLLLDEQPEAMDAYLKALRIMLKFSPHLGVEPIDDEINFVSILNLGKKLSPPHEQIRQLLLLARASKQLRRGEPYDLTDAMSKEAKAGKLGKADRALIIVGGASNMTSGAKQRKGFQETIGWALKHSDGLVCSGGTRSGIPGVVGVKAATLKPKEKRFNLVGYVPAVPKKLKGDLQPDRKRYDVIVQSAGEDFSALEPIQCWVDLLGIGVKPENVRLLGFEGGKIAAVEYRLGLALGAKVAVVPGSGRSADALLNDPEWAGDPDLIRLYEQVHEEATIRAFVRHSTSEFKNLDELAALVHEAYLRGTPYSDSDPIRQKFSKLRHDLKDSNRQQVLYASEILASEGYGVEFIGNPDEINQPEFAPDEVQRMAALEHGRWNIERLTSGWRPTRGKKDVATKTNPNLVRWEELDGGTQKYDFDAINNYAELLRRGGYRIVKRGATPRGKPLAMSVKVLIRNVDGKYLAIRRSMESKHNAGKWDLPGGKVDLGEDFMTALKREVQEETGLVIRPRRLAGSSQSEAPAKIIVYLIILADLVSGEAKISDEHSEYKWVAADQLATLDICDQFKSITQNPDAWEQK